MSRKFEYVSRVLSTGYEMKEPDFILPKRATKTSVAYDIYSPIDFEVKSKETYMLWTGIKAKFQDDEALLINVRSSMGKKHMMLANSQGWIESDYYNNSDNEGEIGVMLYNFGDETFKVQKNDRIAQAMFIKYLITEDDNTEETRCGGFGSTNK